jgi:hypothetical protein
MQLIYLMQFVKSLQNGLFLLGHSSYESENSACEDES